MSILQSVKGSVACVLGRNCLIPRRSPRRMFGQPASETHPHLMAENDVTPGISKNVYHKRRERLIEAVCRRQFLQNLTGDSHMCIIPSAAMKFMTHDIPYVFRQNTDFLYLCGFLEPNSVLVLESKANNTSNFTSTLFVPDKDPAKELWEGERSGTSGAVQLTGVDAAHSIDSFSHYLEEHIVQNSKPVVWYEYRDPSQPELHNKSLQTFFRRCKLTEIQNVTPLIQELRWRKSEEEIELMQKSNDIASASFCEVMKFSQHDSEESHLWAKMDYECRIRGAQYLAYTPVVAGGNRANTIHYIKNNQQVRDGDLVLMDAGCEYHGYASDITRTWPVSGEFTAPQRELYETVLYVQEICITMCKLQDISMNQLHAEMIHVLAQQLASIGVIKTTNEHDRLMMARKLCPHHLGHFLGMDVHDTHRIPISRTLKPGAIVTVEPGIYVPETDQDVPKWFRGIGIRIEDNVLITEGGYKNLTTCPKRADDIEKLMSSR